MANLSGRDAYGFECLKKTYDAARARIMKLRTDLESETARADAAERQVRDMRRELDRVRHRLRQSEKGAR